MAMGSVYGETGPSILETMFMAPKKGMVNILTKMEGFIRVCGKRENLTNFAIRLERTSSIYIDFSFRLIKLGM